LRLKPIGRMGHTDPAHNMDAVRRHGVKLDKGQAWTRGYSVLGNATATMAAQDCEAL